MYVLDHDFMLLLLTLPLLLLLPLPLLLLLPLLPMRRATAVCCVRGGGWSAT